MTHAAPWRPIEEAPTDGRVITARRVHRGKKIWAGECAWRTFSDDAPMRQWSDGGLDGPTPPDIEFADTPNWLMPDGLFRVPTPTEYLAEN